ncbi:MAG: transposase, partial [Leptospirales bacterium]
MANYKHTNPNQVEFTVIDYRKQLEANPMAMAIEEIIDTKIDLKIFDKQFKNDETGASAYNPKIILKAILYAYTRGIIGSRRIAKLCEENVIFMTLAEKQAPHYTYIAAFVHKFEDE